MRFPKVLRTRIIPPPTSARTLYRQRISDALVEAMNYRLTIFLAGAGYGKSTALAGLSRNIQPVLWYQVHERDSDPVIFLLHLCHATQLALPELVGLPLQFLEAWDGSQGVFPWSGVLDQYLNVISEHLNQPVLLVLDDVTQAAGSYEIAHLLDRLVGLAPTQMHILMAGRPPLTLPNLTRWRLQGEVLTIEQSILAFTADEVALLFLQHFGYELTDQEIDAILKFTEGWAIALRLIWQSLRSGPSPSLEEALYGQSRVTGLLKRSSRERLFEILAGEVYENQPVDVREFLLISATLREMTVEACDYIRSTGDRIVRDSGAMLDYLRKQELFVVDHNDGSLRYHHIFHEFLRQQATHEQRCEWNDRAARFYQSINNHDMAIQHMLLSESWTSAAALLEEYGAQMVSGGRLDSLGAYIDALPPEVLHQYPGLLFYLGDLARLRSRFPEALGWYQQAEAIWRGRSQMDGVARSLRGQARVYLDTVNPSKAEQLLEQAIRVSDGIDDRDAQVRLYELLAENKLNSGRVADAESLRLKADVMREEGPSDSQLLYRVLLRTGRLEEARRRLEACADDEQKKPVYMPRAHRETLLLLSLINALEGRADDAYRTAIEGTKRGSTLNSPYISAVGIMRQGHALMLSDLHSERAVNERYGLAKQLFEKSIEISLNLAVPRLRVEAYWGLCHAYGYQGDISGAQLAAEEGLAIATSAGDEWIASLIRLTMGASLVLAGRYESAEIWLSKAVIGFQECSDSFCLTAARLWLCLVWHRQKDFHPVSNRYSGVTRMAQVLPEALQSCKVGHYDFLFTRGTLLGPPDERSFVPLLLLARSLDWESAYTSHLLDQLGLSTVELHPGYQLRVFTLGTFQVWRGQVAIQAGDWRREKARQLFQVFLTFADVSRRGELLDRDQIMEFLWADLDPVTAQRNFKIALNTLYQVLEPEREPGSESAFIVREGTAYGLRPGADLWLDLEKFMQLAHQADSLWEKESESAISVMEQVIQLYQGEYLPDLRYENWTVTRRDHLAAKFLQIADRLTEKYLLQKRYSEVIQLGQRILIQDNCWERAYRYLMLAYAGMGDHGQIGRTYQRCLQCLSNELEIPPARETYHLFLQLTT